MNSKHPSEICKQSLHSALDIFYELNLSQFVQLVNWKHTGVMSYLNSVSKNVFVLIVSLLHFNTFKV